MPVNEVKCKQCGISEVEHRVSDMFKLNDKFMITCPGCGEPSEILCCLTMQNNDWFRPHFNRDISLHGTYIHSKRQLKELCLKNGVTNHALGDVRNITEI